MNTSRHKRTAADRATDYPNLDFDTDVVDNGSRSIGTRFIELFIFERLPLNSYRLRKNKRFQTFRKRVTFVVSNEKNVKRARDVCQGCIVAYEQ